VAVVAAVVLLRGRFGGEHEATGGTGETVAAGRGASLDQGGTTTSPHDLRRDPPASPPRTTGRGTSSSDPGGEQRLGQAIAKHESLVWVEVPCEVVKLLPDDVETPRHQRFLVEIVSGDTILVAHNIDAAARVPLKVGRSIVVRGRYEWNERGGVLHFTHRDGRGRERGWIDAGGRRYE